MLRIALVALLCLLPMAPVSAARVTAVTAEITSDASIPPLVRERMAESVRVIGEQLLLGARTETMATGEKEQLIHEVFDKVLVGYSVRGVRVTPGEETTVRVSLVPWLAVVRSVSVETSVEGMPPQVERLVLADAEGLQSVFEEALLGLPVAATDWTNGVLKKHLRSYLDAKLPEFRADFDVETAETAHVKVVLYPRLPVVRATDLSMRSDTMPNFALLAHRKMVQDDADALVGVPVDFISRHRETFEQEIGAHLDAQDDFRALRMHTDVTITPAERLDVMSRSDSSRYRARLTGWLDIGRSETEHHKREEDLLFRLHLGRMITPSDELFFRTDVHPQDVDWRFEVGFAHLFSPAARAELRYDLSHKDFIYGAFYRFAPRWTLRYEYRGADSMGEAGLRYDIHDFLGVELVRDNEEGWLRLIGNF